MTDDELQGSERYQVRHKPGCIRVLDRQTEQVEGYWWPDCEEWVDLNHLYIDEPADLIPRMENIRERLTGQREQELDVALEIVNYVMAQLEQMTDEQCSETSGEDTADADTGDGSEQYRGCETRSSQSSHEKATISAASKPEPKPAAELVTFQNGLVAPFPVGRDDLDRVKKAEPLFTAEQFIVVMERHRERACYCNGGDGVNEPECHFCAFARHLREDFT